MAYLKAVKNEYCAFLEVPTKFSVAHCPVQGECAQRVCSRKVCLNIGITIEFFVMVSEFFEQSVNFTAHRGKLCLPQGGRNATHCIFYFYFCIFLFFIWGERDGFLERDEFAAQFGRELSNTK